jgi:hypothetical protein
MALQHAPRLHVLVDAVGQACSEAKADERKVEKGDEDAEAARLARGPRHERVTSHADDLGKGQGGDNLCKS